MSKKLSVNCYSVEPLCAEAFRHLVASYDEPSSWEEAQARSGHEPPTVEILYEEANDKGVIGFDIWFSSTSVGFYFGQAWEKRRRAATRDAALTVRTRLQALRDEELRLVLKDAFRGLSQQEEQELTELGPQQEALFPQAAQVLGWDWAKMTAAGRLRYATPNQTEIMLGALAKLIGGQDNG